MFRFVSPVASERAPRGPATSIESVRIEWPTIICQAGTSACWEPRTTTTIASKRGLSKKKKKKRRLVEEGREKRKKKTKLAPTVSRLGE